MKKVIFLTGFNKNKLLNIYSKERDIKSKILDFSHIQNTGFIFKEIKFSLENYDKLFVIISFNKRNTRRDLYNNIKSLDKSIFVFTYISHSPFKILSKTDKKLTKEKYINFEVPRKNVDTDDFKLITYLRDKDRNFIINEYIKEIKFKITESHNNPFHIESILEHILLTYKNSNNKIMREISLFHDYGKSMARRSFKPTEKTLDFYYNNHQKFERYTNHEKLSSVYYLIFNEEKYDEDVLEVIFQHSDYSKGIFNKKRINNNKLTSYILELLEEFRKIDNDSKIFWKEK